MAHQIGEHSDIIVTVQKAFGKTMAEGMRIYDGRRKTVFCTKIFELACNAAGCDSLSLLVDKNKAALFSAVLQPGESLLLQGRGNIDPAQLAAFGVEIQITDFDMLHFDLHQLTDAGAGGSQKTDHEIPVDSWSLHRQFLKYR